MNRWLKFFHKPAIKVGKAWQALQLLSVTGDWPFHYCLDLFGIGNIIDVTLKHS